MNSEHAQARTQLEQEGWCVIPDVLSQDECKSILERLWEFRNKGEQKGEQSYIPSLDPNESNVRLFYLLEDEVFRNLATHPLAVQIVQATLGENFLISNFTGNIARPGSGSMALHSDQSLVVPDPWKEAWAMNVIWCLTDVYKENGATLFIPGSNEWESKSDIAQNAPELLRPFEAKAGSIILMDGKVWHTSGANVTKDQDRALLFGFYTKPFLRQQINWTARLSRELQESLSEDVKAMLGLNVEANTRSTGADMRFLSQQFATTAKA